MLDFSGNQTRVSHHFVAVGLDPAVRKTRGSPVYPNRQLVTRLLNGRCELCKQTDNITVHHVRKLADPDRPGQPQPEWAKVMAKIRRKALVVCGDCHDLIHGRPAAPLTQ